MTIIRVLIAFFAALIAAVSAAAQSAPVELDDRSRAQLASGERTRVIVQFDLRELAFDGLNREDQDMARRDAIHGTTDAILQRVFQSDRAGLSVHQAVTGGPRLARSFDYTPAFAIYVNRDELDALVADPVVSRIVTDGLDRPTLDESVPQIGANLLHAAGIAGQNATIAVLDTGIHYNHPAFITGILRSACFSTANAEDSATSNCVGGALEDTESPNAAAACSASGCAHGTLVASIVAGSPGNAPGLGDYDQIGVAYSASIVPVQVFSTFSGSGVCETPVPCTLSYISDQVRALEWLYANRLALNITAINMSLGGSPRYGACDADPRASIINQLYAANIATVVSTGNDGINNQVSPPACITSAFAVGGEQFNRGAMTDVFAPATATAAGNIANNQLTATASGTSISAPHVSGTMALLSQFIGSRGIGAVLEAIETTGRPVSVSDPEGNRIIPFIRADLAWALLADEAGISGSLTVTPEAAQQLNASFANNQSNASVEYTVTNTGSVTTGWLLSYEGENLVFDHSGDQTNDSRLGITTVSGNLLPGASTVITVSPSSTVPVGQYTERLTISGAGAVAVRSIILNVTRTTPANDNIANALPMFGDNTLVEYKTDAATSEPGEPDHGGGGRTIWFTWTAPYSGSFALETWSRAVSVYSTNDFAAMADNTTLRIGPSDSRYQEFQAIGGVEYFIAVDGPTRRAARDDQYFTIETRRDFPGVSVTNPIELADRSGTFVRGWASSGYNLDDPSEPTEFDNEQARHWYRWTAPYSGQFELSDRADPADTGPENIAVYTRADGAQHHDPGADGWADFELVVAANWNEAVLENRRLEFSVEEGRTYWFRAGQLTGSSDQRLSYGRPRQADHMLRAAILPESRTTLVGRPVTAFLTLINPGRFQTTAENCRIEWADGIFSRVNYRLANAANQPFGQTNPLFNIGPGQIQNFVIEITPSTIARNGSLQLQYICDNVASLMESRNADQFRIGSLDVVVPDMIAIAATPSNDGVIRLQPGQTRAISLAAMNISDASGRMEIYFAPTASHIPRFEFCMTDPTTGVCIDSRVSHSYIFDVAPGQIVTFTGFITAGDTAVAFDPARNRVRATIYGRTPDTGDIVTVGATSVAYDIQ